MDGLFWINSALLGAGLAADAFSVSVANGLADPLLSRRRGAGIALTFAFFQFIMPMLGWVCVHTVVQVFRRAQQFVPYIALALLLYIGGKMILENIRHKSSSASAARVLTPRTLLVQGIATSIDALSVGFTIETYPVKTALCACAAIAAVTFLLCTCGILLGKKFGARFQRAELFGGLILIAIGIEIFVKGLLS